MCSVLKSVDGPFAPALVDGDASIYLQLCQYDVCQCYYDGGDATSCEPAVCMVAEQFARTSAVKGVVLENWRSADFCREYNIR
jgi:hypothetical protein